VIYLDSSALVKLVFEESESRALERWLADRDDQPKISSELSTVELLRTCRRLNEGAVDGARQVLAGLDLLPIAGDVLDQAALVDPAELRSLDAIHLASALIVKEELIAFVVYDARLRTAARNVSLDVVTPE
jgi:uncharacterized protein